MRGLDTRVALAHARILNVTDPVAAQEALDAVSLLAWREGFADRAADLHTPPVMFADEPNLLFWWANGYDDHRVDVAISNHYKP
jgi:hypothetical protein